MQRPTKRAFPASVLRLECAILANRVSKFMAPSLPEHVHETTRNAIGKARGKVRIAADGEARSDVEARV